MEPTQANVRSIDALGRLRAAIVQCLDDLKVAISEAETEVSKAEAWVTGDRIPHWRRRQQQLAEEVNSARSALFRKETVTSSKDSKPSVVDEKKALARAKAMLDDAGERARRSRAWAIEMPREQAIFKRGISPLASMVDRDLPAAIHALGRMIEALEGYHRGPLPDLKTLLGREGQGSERAAGMRRGVDGGQGAGSVPDAGGGEVPGASTDAGSPKS